MDNFAAPLDDELVYGYSIGLVLRKPELLSRFRHALCGRYLQRTFRQVLANGDFALLTMTQRMPVHLAANPQQELEAKTFASAMWRRRGQRWQLLQLPANELEATQGVEVFVVLQSSPRHRRLLRAGAGADPSLSL